MVEIGKYKRNFLKKSDVEYEQEMAGRKFSGCGRARE